MQKQVNTLQQMFDSIPPDWLVEKNFTKFCERDRN